MDQLYYAPGAASMLVHWLLLELDIPHELHLVDTSGGAQKRPEYLALNPHGVVPTLIHAGQPMFEAAALAMTLADRQPKAGLAPSPDDPLRPQYTQWMFHLANAVQPLFRLWWYPQEAAGAEHADAVRHHVAPRIEAVWGHIDAHLAAQGPAVNEPAVHEPAVHEPAVYEHYLLGDKLSAADFYLTMLMRWSRGMPKPATEWPQLAALAQRMRARPSFQALCQSEGLSEWA